LDAKAVCTNPAVATTLTLPEDLPIGTILYTYSGRDPEGHTFYYLAYGGAKEPFSFSGRNLSLSSALDFENLTSLIVNNIGVLDASADKSHTHFCPLLTIHVLPVNEYDPVLTPTPQTVTIPEGSPQDLYVADVACSDQDKEPVGGPDGCSIISIESGDDATQKFKLTSNIVNDTVLNATILTTNNVIDYDTGDVRYVLYVIGVDSSTRDARRTGTMTLTINIQPVNEFTPSIQNQPLGTSIPEDTRVGTEILNVNATDSDAGPHGELTYKIIDGNLENKFMISKTTGKIYLRNLVDYESTTKAYSFTIEARDGGGLSSTAVVNVTITDVNDNKPECFPKEHNITIPEDQSILSTVLNITCTDRDAGATLTYQILSGDLGHFQISSVGELKVSQALGFDDGISIYYMMLEISDGIHFTKVWVLIQLTSVNDFIPVLANKIVTVNEKAVIGDEIIEFKADDPDAQPHGVTSYQILSVKNGNIEDFYIEKSSGKIFLTQTLDFESVPQYEIVVKATDGGGKTATGTVTVNVNNENDNAPICTTPVSIISVSENAGVGVVIVKDFGCSDVDNDPLIYTLTQVPADNGFEVLTNQLRVKGNLDYETATFYSITVTVSDGSLSTQIKVAVNILNENEDAPRFVNQVVNGTLSEDDVVGKSISTVLAVDPDNDEVTYSFVGIQPNFMIDPKTGKITLRAPVDREKQPSINLFVLASDGKLSSTATVSVTVMDVNEPPEFGSTNYQFSTEENTLIGGTVGTVSAADADLGALNGQVGYKILSGNDESYFRLESITGVLTIKSPVDYEKFKTALLVVEASDFGSPSLSGICTVIIQVLDRNDNAPEFLSPTLQEKVSEDMALGQQITQVFAFDKDSSASGNNKVSYRSASVVPFQVDSTSGVVSLTGSLDRETISRFQMLILAVDEGTPQMTGTLALEIILNDVNDNDPVITGSYLTTVSENVPENFLIFNINASDLDGELFGKLKYEIASSEMKTVFKIEPNTGVLQVASPLDRESVDKYEVVIRVSDNGLPPRSTSVTATINVGDVNDITPTFTEKYYEFVVQEHVVLGTFFGKITALDDDIGTNSELKHKIATYWKGSVGKFGINEITGDIYTTGELDRETEDEYRILFRVQDGGTPPLSSDVTVKILVSDINDNAPVFRRPKYSTAFFENLPTGSKVLQTGAIDKDIGVNAAIRYELDISTEIGLRADYYFGVYGETGDIYLKKRVDRETYEKFILTILARDNGMPSLSTKVNISIQIEDVNDNEPIFSPAFYNTEASIINLCDEIIARLTASDADVGRNAALNIGLDPKDSNSPFSVSPLGVVNRKAELTQSKYIIHVLAHDNGNPVLMSSEKATIRIDRFDPDEVVVTFYFEMTFSSYLQKETNFLLQLEEALHLRYSTAYIKRWCIEDKTSSFLMVHVYAVKTDITNDVNNLHRDKVFLTNGEFLNVLQLDFDERPTVDIN
ncbi:protocadherin Fat 4-like, partial [Saccostrea cucullata]|uniref:protocadherin Fat 4-like n=1 Tax=Saccostrea cuccullata TaxID=36930 RepID=UPI002ED35931